MAFSTNSLLTNANILGNKLTSITTKLPKKPPRTELRNMNPQVASPVSGLSDFLSAIDHAGGLSRPNRFQVHINAAWLYAKAKGTGYAGWFTDYASKGALATTKRLAFFCNMAELPGYQFVTDLQRYNGAKFQYPTVPQYQDLVLSFFVGEDMEEKFFFEAWMYLIMEPSTNDFNYMSEYTTTVDVFQMDAHNRTQYSVRLIDAYPISVATMKLDWNENNVVHKLDVTFTYKRLEPFNRGDTTGTATAAARANTQHTFDQTVSYQPGPEVGVLEGAKELIK